MSQIIHTSTQSYSTCSIARTSRSPTGIRPKIPTRIRGVTPSHIATPVVGVVAAGTVAARPCTPLCAQSARTGRRATRILATITSPPIRALTRTTNTFTALPAVYFHAQLAWHTVPKVQTDVLVFLKVVGHCECRITHAVSQSAGHTREIRLVVPSSPEKIRVVCAPAPATCILIVCKNWLC